MSGQSYRGMIQDARPDVPRDDLRKEEVSDWKAIAEWGGDVFDERGGVPLESGVVYDTYG